MLHIEICQIGSQTAFCLFRFLRQLSFCLKLYVEHGRLSRVTVKKERIHGKILSVTEDTVEIEGYGTIPLDENFYEYKLFGEFSVLGAADILVGYDLQEFVAADGKLCAALLERPFDARTIRVLLMDTGFKNLFHKKVRMALCPLIRTVS